MLNECRIEIDSYTEKDLLSNHEDREPTNGRLAALGSAESSRTSTHEIKERVQNSSLHELHVLYGEITL